MGSHKMTFVQAFRARRFALRDRNFLKQARRWTLAERAADTEAEADASLARAAWLIRRPTGHAGLAAKLLIAASTGASDLNVRARAAARKLLPGIG